MNIASIDIGTNTVLLLIAEVDVKTSNIKTLHNEYRIPRIGKGLRPGIPITDDKVFELTKILWNYKNIADEYNCKKIIATATNAFRIASNGEEIINLIRIKLGIQIEIIKGEDEARYSYLGAAGSNSENENTLVIDIGGGSTELVLGNSHTILFKKSFQIGAASGTENYFFHAPPENDELRNFDVAMDKIFEELKNSSLIIDRAVAIAGTPTTLACIKMGLDKFDEELIEGSYIKLHELYTLIGQLQKLNTNDILLNFNSIVKGREDIILSGSYILYYIMKTLRLDNVIVSTKGIRYGAIINYMNI